MPELAAIAAPPPGGTPDRTMIVRIPRRSRGFDATTLLVSSVAGAAFVAFAVIAALA